MFTSSINVKLGSLRYSPAVTAKKCTKTRDARAEVLFCLSKGSSRQAEQFDRIFHLHGTVQYFCWVHTELKIQVKFQFDSTQRPGATLKGDAFDGKGNENGRTH